MKNLTLTVALLIALHASAHAQETTTSKPTDAEKYITWYRDCPVCDAFVSNGDEIRIIRNQGVTIAVAVGDTGKNYAAEIVVLNGSDRRVLVDPEKTLFEIKDGGGNKLAYRSTPEHVASSIRTRAKWGNFFRSIAAGFATQTVTSQSSTTGSVYATGSGGYENGTFNANTTTRTTVPDYEARRQAAEANQAASDVAEAKARNVLETALRANTLFPNQYVGGMVYLEHKKFNQLAALLILIDGVFYEFQVAPLK